MSFSLFKATAKSNWLIFLIFFAILLMYMTVMVGMYDPDSIEAMNQFIEAMPQGMMEAFGYGDTATSLATFMALYYYGFIIIIFPLIYCIILANRLVAALVDRGSMAYLLATPNTRVKIITTLAVYMATSITLLLLINTGIGLALSESMFPGKMDIPAFLKLNLAAILLTLAISSICFFFSCIFHETKYSLAFGGGIPILFFIINMLRNIGDSNQWLKYLTLYSLFDANAIVTGEQSIITLCLISSAIFLALYGAGIIIFSRRNLFL
ncbi:MAG: ABC transporter permease subunit [Bacillota bacterium]|nr:ABC transporter permease subunit [Bacillota bacterium]